MCVYVCVDGGMMLGMKRRNGEMKGIIWEQNAGDERRGASKTV
jgi:hypothetical protein